MTTVIHPAPEEIMALLDGEVASAEALSLSQHIEECVECAAVRDQIRGTSETMAAWTVPAVPPALDRAIEERLASAPPARAETRPQAYTPLSARNWRLWAIGGSGLAAGILVVSGIAFHILSSTQQSVAYQARVMGDIEPQSPTPSLPSSSGGVVAIDGGATADSLQAVSPPAPPPPRPQAGRARSEAMNGPLESRAAKARGIVGGAVPAPATPAPMIARTVLLTILVRNVSSARTALDSILAQQHGYAAQLTLETPENGARSFQASLRIPAPALDAALGALRSLGRVQVETQSGEEVTQQHADLVARLTNARETEQRLREILQQRAGKMEDVLEVEESISEKRGEIEQMEANQKALEHRVDFATVDLRLVEEYKAQLGGDSASVGTRLHNSFVAGLRNAGGSLLGITLWIEEAVPTLLIWIVILGIPAVLVWRRYRRARASLL